MTRAERRLAAILAADVVGYSRLMAADEAGTHARLKALRKDVIEPIITEHRGRLVKLMGDGALVEFASAVDAVECAVTVQKAVAECQVEVQEDQRIAFRIGINIGDIIIENDDIYGGGVNVAARLEGLAEPGGICVSRNVYNQVKDKVTFGFEPAGEHTVKNIPEPVTVYCVIVEPGAIAKVVGLKRAGTPRWRLAALAAALVFAVGAGVIAWYQPWASDSERSGAEEMALLLPDKPSIAVLPFDNLSGDPEEEYFADGLTDDLITDLSKISGLFTIARNSAFEYKDQPTDVREVAGELGVRYILEGSVRRAGGRIRINAQLIDGTTGAHVWAERFERESGDIFAVQDRVIEQIVAALSVHLTDAEQRQVSRPPTDSLEAYDYYLRAEEELHAPEEEVSVVRALALYEKAIAHDDAFAEAYAGYARAAAYFWVDSHDAFVAGTLARERIYEMAGRALALNPGLARAHAVLAQVQLVDGEHAAALASARRAVDLGPSNVEAHATLAWVLAYAGQPSEAVAVSETALRLDPKPSAVVLLAASLALFLDKQYGRAIDRLHQVRELAPGLKELHEYLAMTYAQAGKLKEARAQAAKIRAFFPGASLRFYRIVDAHHKRPEDLATRLEGLAKAGIPEWPFGFRDRPERRIDGAQLRGLTFGQTWRGQHEKGEPFFFQVADDGTYAYSSPSSMRTGHFFVRDGMLCYQSQDFMLGRHNCGYVYPNQETPGEFDYVYVNAFSAMHFSLAK